MNDKIIALILFVRLSALGGTIVMVILGAGTVTPHPGIIKILGLIGSGIAFHIYSYLLNDVIDLPIDRNEPRRVNFPLVRGTISTVATLVMALIQIPVAIFLTYLNQGGIPAYVTLMISFVCLGIYNIWGKKAIFPPLTDFVQGLGWGGLGLYGAYLTAGHISTATMVLFAYIVIMILMSNGVHGSVRDLKNDFQCGVRSTAIMFGTRSELDERVQITASLRRYAQLLNLLLVSIALCTLGINWFGYNRMALLWTIGVEIILSMLSLWALHLIARPVQNQGELNSGGMLHLLVVFLMMIVLFIPGMDIALSSLVLLLFLAPLLSHSWFYAGILWGLRKSKLINNE